MNPDTDCPAWDTFDLIEWSLLMPLFDLGVEVDLDAVQDDTLQVAALGWGAVRLVREANGTFTIEMQTGTSGEWVVADERVMPVEVGRAALDCVMRAQKQ
jgi:hypothetical protein